MEVKKRGNKFGERVHKVMSSLMLLWLSAGESII